jgi:predicted MFS family arabinose efflux permease
MAAGPIWAKFSDIWGRKLALLSAVGIFAVASILAAVSSSMEMLIAARALQGSAGGALMQLMYITISDLFSVRSRALYFGLAGVIWAIAGSVGPLIGGAFTQLATWRWCFWINLPICGIAFILILLFLDVHNPQTKLSEGVRAVDWLGTISLLAVTLLLLLGLDFGGAIFPWSSPKVICLLVSGALMVGLFVFIEKALARYPLMPLSIFQDKSNVAVFLVAFAHSTVVIAGEYYLPLYFQAVQQASPLRSGVLILPMMITEATIDIATGIFIHQTGYYRGLIWVGTTTMTLGTGLYVTFQTDTSTATIIGLEIVASVGIACLFQTPVLAIQNTVSQADTATASAALSFVRNLATSLSIVLGGVVFQNSMDIRQSTLAAAGLPESVLEALSGSHAAANVDIVQTLQDPTQRRIAQDAFAWSIRNMFIMYTCISALGVMASPFIKQHRLKTEHTETKTGIKQMTERYSQTKTESDQR